MILESAVHAGSCFVTLTYNELTLPFGSKLVKKDVQDWIKRLRQVLYPQKIRYFLVGEYGDSTNRPHYHAAIFGLDQSLGGGTDGRRGLVALTWKNGHSYTGDLSTKSASYICGYVTKKMTKKSDPRLKGRPPEFSLMSLRPGIGAPAMEHIDAGLVRTGMDARFMEENADVPTVLQYGGRKLPLGRYLRSILRAKMGYGRKANEESSLQVQARMLSLWKEEILSPINYIDARKQKMLNAEKKFKLRDKRGVL